MTIEKDADFLRGILNGTSHDLPCVCPACLYATYRKKIKVKIKIQKGARTEKKGLPGPPFAPLAFFVRYWIARRGGIDEAKKIIRDVQADLAPTITDEDISIAIHRNRGDRIEFERLLVALENERRWAWIRKKADPAEEWMVDRKARRAKDREEVELSREIVQYVRDREVPTTMRDLERRFRPARKVEIERALVSNLDSGLRIGTKGKSIVFYWKPLTSAEIKALNRRAGEKAIREAAASWREFRKVEGDEAYREAWKKHVEEMARRVVLGGNMRRRKAAPGRAGS